MILPKQFYSSLIFSYLQLNLTVRHNPATRVHPGPQQERVIFKEQNCTFFKRRYEESYFSISNENYFANCNFVQKSSKLSITYYQLLFNIGLQKMNTILEQKKTPRFTYTFMILKHHWKSSCLFLSIQNLIFYNFSLHFQRK